MAIEINSAGPGNLDNKNFYVDQNNNFYYDALYDRLPEIPGQFSGNIVEIKDWNTGETLLGPALGNLDFSVSNYRPPVAGSVNLSGQTKPSDLFTLKQNSAPQDPEPLDIAAMNLAAEKQVAALAKSNNASEQLQSAQDARVENANTVTPEPVEQTAQDNTSSTKESSVNTGRIAGAKTNAIKDPLANQLTTDETVAGFDAQAAADARLSQEAANAQPTFTPDTNDGDYLAKDSLADLTAGPTADTNDGDYLATDSLQSLTTNKEETGTTGTGGDGVNTQGTDSQAGGASPLPSQFLEKIVPKTNPLAQFATYTYNVSVYLVNKAGLQRLQNGEKSVAGLPIIMQSGGAPADGIADMYGAKRSSFFSLDYYIDDIEMEGVISGTSTQSIHNQHTIKFTVTEPNGLSFLDNLHGAVKEYKTSLGFAAEKINYAAQMYLMVVRFKGHQIDGIPETLGEMTGDANGYSEKYIPFMFTGVRFRVENNKVVYHCEAAAPMSIYNLNSTHAAIPFNVELNGGTVGDVLTANQVTGKELPQSEREAQDAAALGNIKEQKATVYTGLVQALNENSLKAYGEEFANVYRIEFEEGAEFEKKKITLPSSQTNKERTPMKSSKEQPQAGATDRIKKESRTKTIQAGTSIVQAIEQIVRGSEYVTSQQMIVIDEGTGQPKPADNTNPQPFQWFKVVMQTTPRSDKVNPATNDFAYEIVYKIKRYQVGNINSAYFPPPIFRGVHKRYPYWFTGENTEVRHFQQDFNYLYFQQIATKVPGLKLPEINATHVARNYYMPRSNESSEGLTNKSGEIAASAASTLYSPGDLAQADITINGDPDWIAQSEVFYGVDRANNNPFEEDGSVNFNASEVYFGIEWNTPQDFTDTGEQKITRYDTTSMDPLINLVYRANTVKTKLSQGEFTQTLSGTLMTWTDSEYVTRTDRGFKYDAQKRVDDINKAIIERDEAAADDLFWAEQDAIQEQVNIRSAESIVAEQDAEFADWEDNATTDAPTTTQAAEFTDADEAEQRRLERGIETADQINERLNQQEFGDWDTEEVAPTSTSPAFTPNQTVKPADAVETQQPANPNTMTQNTITKTGGDKTVTQTPLVTPTPVQPAYSGPGYTEPESNLTLPTDTTNTGVDSDGMIYGDYKGQQILGGTQGAIDAQKRAIDTGQTTTYEDIEYGLTAGDAERVRRKFDPVSGTDEIVAYFNNKTGRWEDAFGNAI